MDTEWEHNHSLETLEASNFREISPECIERALKLSESGHTPVTERTKKSCQDELEFHRKKANWAVMPRRRDFSHKSFSTSFGPFTQFLVVISHNNFK